MRPNRIRAWCARCRHEQVFERDEMNHKWHLFLTVCTLGIWSIAWISATIGGFFRPWRCKHCGWAAHGEDVLKARRAKQEG